MNKVISKFFSCGFYYEGNHIMHEDGYKKKVDDLYSFIRKNVKRYLNGYHSEVIDIMLDNDPKLTLEIVSEVEHYL